MKMEKHNLLKIAEDIIEDKPGLMECIIEHVIDSGWIVQCTRCESWEYKGEFKNGKCQHCE